MEDAHEFGARVAVLREQRGLNQEKFAEALGPGWSQSDVSKLERGTKPIYIAELVRITEILDVSMATLFEDDESAVALPILTPELRSLLRAGALLPPPILVAITQHARNLHRGLTSYLSGPIPEQR